MMGPCLATKDGNVGGGGGDGIRYDGVVSMLVYFSSKVSRNVVLVTLV